MKKRFYVLIFLIAMFIGIGKVNAYTIDPNQDCYTTNSSKICNLKARGVDTGDFNRVTVDVYYQVNSQLSSGIINSSWTVISSSDLSGATIQGKSYFRGKRYVLVYNKNTVPSGNIDIGTFAFSITGFDDCSVAFQPNFGCENRECKKENGIYYNHNGDVVTQSQYREVCGCRIEDNKYYDIDGNETTALNFAKSCLTCVALVDGTYIGSTGAEVTQDEFVRQCGYSCIKIDDTYYDSNGNPVSESEYYHSCFPATCHETTLSDNLKIYYGKNGSLVTRATYEDECLEKPKCKIEDNKYYDRNGNVTDEETYAKQCTTVTCRILSDGTIYGKDGQVVDKLTYEKQCAVHTCEILSDGTHYDKDGKVVTKDEYLKSCYKCRKENGKYYDENGKETSEDNFKIMCEPHKCEVFGDKYFNDKGFLVPKDQYYKACTNPKTGSIDGKNISYIISGILFAGAIVFVSLKYGKLKRI